MVASKGSSTISTKMLYYVQKENGGSSSSSNFYTWSLDRTNQLTDVALYPNSQPMTLDVNGDQSMDLLY